VELDKFLDAYPRFVLEALVLWYCFRVILHTPDDRDKSAAWAIVGLVVASIIRNLAVT
jgi:hypothetical protein